MSGNAWIRQIHRWLAIAFTLTVLANIVAAALGSTAMWIGFVALAPLILLMLTGLWMFWLPYRRRGKAG